jgi:mRNA interferase MazF
MSPTPLRGEVWRIRFDPAEGDEIKKVRTGVVISEDAIGRLRLKIVVPITEWKPRYASYPWFVRLTPTPSNGLTNGVRGRFFSGQIRLGNTIPRPIGRADAEPARRYRQCDRDLRGCPLSANPSMTLLSDRQHDAFDNAVKKACREGNLRLLSGAGLLALGRRGGDSAALRLA